MINLRCMWLGRRSIEKWTLYNMDGSGRKGQAMAYVNKFLSFL